MQTALKESLELFDALAQDYKEAKTKLEVNNTQFSRRNFTRIVFAFVEGETL